MKKLIVLITLALVVTSLPAMAARITTIPIDHPEMLVYQAYPGDSNGTNLAFLGKNGLGDDVITAGPGILAIIPGEDWSNYGSIEQVAETGADYAIKSVRLRKLIPEFLQCSWVYNDLPDVLQRGTDNIRLWWPLMYEAPGTTWILEIVWLVPGELFLYNETWVWKAHATLDSIKSLMRLFHELPWSTCEVPLISDECLFPLLLAKVDEIQAAWPGDQIGALNALLEFENMVIDNCITSCPPTPMPCDEFGRLGITNTDENPACCKLLVDAEFVGFDMGIFTPDM